MVVAQQILPADLTVVAMAEQPVLALHLLVVVAVVLLTLDRLPILSLIEKS